MRAGWRARFLRFVIVGTSVAAVYIGLDFALMKRGLPWVPANVLAFGIAVVLQYVGQSSFTFGSVLADRGQIGRFALMIGMGLLTSSQITGALAPAMGLSAWLAALLVAMLLPVQNFVIMVIWVFQPSLRADDSQT